MKIQLLYFGRPGENLKLTNATVQAPGTLKRLSVAVLVDNAKTTAEDGTVTETPLKEEQIANMTRLVKDAVGFEEGEHLFDLVGGGGDLVGERFVDLVVGEKTPLLAQREELSDLLVLRLDSRGLFALLLRHRPLVFTSTCRGTEHPCLDRAAWPSPARAIQRPLAPRE